ncbi:hypothetical protein ABZ883_40605 [Streptomyces sp. NPDC046977]|uniref:hypothetical protein n=1 Tax=Streptomyces sp. NPDC046977 TaxID=3154703 RepID=UPI0033D34C9B
MPVDPYVTAAEFAAHPTYLELDNLRQDVTEPAAQTAVLTNLLLASSDWADGECNQPLGAHVMTRKSRARVDAYGNLQLVASHWPIIAVTAVAYGPSPTALTPVLDLSSVWVEADRMALLPISAPRSTGAGLFVNWTYIAGRVAALTNESADEGATSLMVTNPLGILPDQSYRLWEPGSEETVTVASDYVPPPWSPVPQPTEIPLAAPTRHAHGEGFSVSGFTADARLAVINYTASVLMRPDTTAEDEFPDNNMSSTRDKDSRPTGLGLVKEARRILASLAAVS